MLYMIAPKREGCVMAEAEVRDPPVHDLTPEDVARGLTEGRMLLVDVREPNETAVERYPDAVIVPLSSFDPSHIPDPQGQAGGVRLPLRPPLGHRVAGRAGARAAVRRASRRRHPGLEGRRPADRKLTRRCYARCSAVVAVRCCSRLAGLAAPLGRRQTAHASTSTTGRTTSSRR